MIPMIPDGDDMKQHLRRAEKIWKEISLQRHSTTTPLDHQLLKDLEKEQIRRKERHLINAAFSLDESRLTEWEKEIQRIKQNLMKHSEEPMPSSSASSMDQLPPLEDDFS